MVEQVAQPRTAEVPPVIRDLFAPPPPPTPKPAVRDRSSVDRAIPGRDRYHRGRAAEDVVARHYSRRGQPESHRRWRGRSGEIDLVFRDGDTVVFTEVKFARTHDAAAARLSRRQGQRIIATAMEFLAGEPKGQLTDTRFDLALVDQQGQVKIVPNDHWF